MASVIDGVDLVYPWLGEEIGHGPVICRNIFVGPGFVVSFLHGILRMSSDFAEGMITLILFTGIVLRMTTMSGLHFQQISKVSNNMKLNFHCIKE